MLGGKRRKKRFVQRFGRGGNPEISSDWLALLTGAKYAGNSDDSEKRVDNWKTKIKDPALEVAGSDDEVILKHELKTETVRVQLAEDKKEEIRDWRNKYNKEKTKGAEGGKSKETTSGDSKAPADLPRPPLYTNANLDEEKFDSDIFSATALFPQPTKTTTRIKATTSNTPKTTSATTTKNKILASMLFWTTTRPAKTTIPWWQEKIFNRINQSGVTNSEVGHSFWRMEK